MPRATSRGRQADALEQLGQDRRDVVAAQLLGQPAEGAGVGGGLSGHGVGQEDGGDDAVRRPRPPTDQLREGLVGPGTGPLQHPGRQRRGLEQLGPQQVLVRHVDEEGQRTRDAGRGGVGDRFGLRAAAGAVGAADGRREGIERGAGDRRRTERREQVGVVDARPSART